MLMVQSVARALQEAGSTDPVKFLTDLNSALFKNIERTKIDKHMTLAFLDYDGTDMVLSGQHEDVIVVQANGDMERIDTIDLGLPIGLEADIAPFVNSVRIPFEKDDLSCFTLTASLRRRTAPGSSSASRDCVTKHCA